MADPQALDTGYAFQPQPQPLPPPGPQLAQQQQPGALQPVAPPLAQPPAVTPGVTTQQAPAQPAFDDDNQYQQAEQIEEDSYAKNLLDASGRKPLMGSMKPENHPDFDKLQEAQDLYKQLTNPKEAKYFEPRIRALQRKIDTDIKAQDAKVKQERADQLHQIDAPRTTPKALAETGAIMQNEIDGIASTITADAQSRDPKKARTAGYDVATSPLSTLAQVGPDGQTTGYAPLRNVATSLSSLNRLPSNDLAVRYALTIGSPVGTDDKGEPLPGLNGVKGKGATNYKVLGRDARDNYLLEMPDRRVLRIDPTTMSTLRQARLKGYAAGQKWEQDRKKADEPGLLTRMVKSVIPDKGF